MNREDLAWAAGFFDGEGCVYINRGFAVITIAQTRPEPLIRFRDAVGCGKVNGPYARTPPRQAVWSFNAGRWTDVQHVVASLWVFLSPPKREQVLRIMTVAKATVQASSGRGNWQTKTHCKRGHDLNDSWKYGRTRTCKKCRAIRLGKVAA